MAREIDKSDLSKLSKADLRYLRDRAQLTPAQEREFLGGIHLNPDANRSADLTEVPNAGDVATAPEPVQEEENGGTPQRDKPYNEQDKPDLIAEIERRNSSRPEDERIRFTSKTTKPELIDLLEDDDEERVAG